MKPHLQFAVFLILSLGSILLAACATADATEVAPPAVEPAAGIPTEIVLSTEPPPASDPVPAATPTAGSVSSGGTSFSTDVLPILQANCTRCHGTSRQSADLKLNTYANLMVGSEDGPVAVPGDAANSSLVELIVSGEMPKRADRLSDEEIQIITDWINAGAPNN